MAVCSALAVLAGTLRRVGAALEQGNAGRLLAAEELVPLGLLARYLPRRPTEQMPCAHIDETNETDPSDREQETP